MRKLLVVLAAAVAVAVPASMAVADQPTKVQMVNVTVSGTLPAGAGCAFDIQVQSLLNGTHTAFVDKTGATWKEQYHLVEQDTFSANGKVLTGVPFTFNVTWLYDSAGNLNHVYADGVMEKVRLPDGSLFISAGRVDFAAHGFPSFILTPDQGATVNLEGFCAALAP